MSSKKKKEKSEDRDDSLTWERIRMPVRQIVYELVLGYGITLAYLIGLIGGGALYALLLSGLAHVVLGSVISLGVGAIGDPVVTLGLCAIRLIDEEVAVDYRWWFVVKSIIRAVASASGAALAGVSIKAVTAGLLSTTILPVNIQAGTLLATGLTLAIVLVLEYHVSILSSISTDDGYGMILSVGLSRFALGLTSFLLWQANPNLNILFGSVVAAMAWTTLCTWVVVITLLAGAAVVGLYYLLLHDVFSSVGKLRNKAENLSDDVNVLLDNKGDVGAGMNGW